MDNSSLPSHIECHYRSNILAYSMQSLILTVLLVLSSFYRWKYLFTDRQKVIYHCAHMKSVTDLGNETKPISPGAHTGPNQ